MTGPDNYLEARRLLAGPDPEAYKLYDPEAFERDRRDNLAAAQVHATLALVALLVDVFGSRIQPRELIAEWAEATR